jgi:hypothetical protein
VIRTSDFSIKGHHASQQYNLLEKYAWIIVPIAWERATAGSALKFSLSIPEDFHEWRWNDALTACNTWMHAGALTCVC